MPQQVLKYPPARRPSELCTIAFLRYAVFSFNTIFMMTGLVLLAFGIWTLMEKSDLFALLSPLYSISVYSTVIAGGIIFIASIIGCQGAVQEKPCSLITFTVLMVVIFVVEIGTGIISYLVFTQMAGQSFSSPISQVNIEQWGEDKVITEAIDHIQLKYKCCGSGYYTDWKNNSLIRATNTSTPDSCCISIVSGCGRIDHPSNLHRQGCSQFIEDGIYLNIVLIPALSLGFSIIQIFGVIFSCALTRRISHTRNFVRRKYNY